MQPFPLDTNVTTKVKSNTFETQKVSIIKIGSYGILIVISEIEQVSLIVIIEEEHPVGF